MNTWMGRLVQCLLVATVFSVTLATCSAWAVQIEQIKDKSQGTVVITVTPKNFKVDPVNNEIHLYWVTPDGASKLADIKEDSTQFDTKLNKIKLVLQDVVYFLAVSDSFHGEFVCRYGGDIGDVYKETFTLNPKPKIIKPAVKSVAPVVH